MPLIHVTSMDEISRIITSFQVSVYADSNRQPKVAFGVLTGFHAKFYSNLISKTLLKELRMIQRIILTWIVKEA